MSKVTNKYFGERGVRFFAIIDKEDSSEASAHKGYVPIIDVNIETKLADMLRKQDLLCSHFYRLLVTRVAG